MAWATSETITIFVIMAAVGLFGIYQVYRLACVGNGFDKARKKLQEEGTAEKVKVYLTQDGSESVDLFEHKSLKAAFEAYRDDVLHLAKLDTASPYNDIRDYFHAEYIDSISFGAICDLIPGTMTGLGLLGTFWGLVVGVGGLDVNSTEGLLNGIDGLLKGMNTAFLTSIVGVIASLVFSFLYKGVYGATLRKIEGFVDVFQEKNLDRADDRPENMLLSYQHQQTEVMKTFAGEVADSISKCMAECMAEILTPVTIKMEATIEEFAKVASAQQKEGLEQVVKEFIHSMNDALGGQFEELGKTIQEMCEWQKNSVAQMQKIVDGICDTSTEIEKINEMSRQTVVEMNRFMEKVNDLQTSINQELELVRQQIETANAINEKNSAYVEKLVEYEAHIAQLADNVKTEAEAARKAVELLQENCEAQIKSLSDAAQTEMGVLAESTKILAEASHQQIQALALTAQDEMRMLTETSAQLAEENKAQLEELTKTSSEQMGLLSDAASSIVDSSKQQIAATIAAAEAQSETLMQTTNDFVDFVKEQNQIFTDAVKQEVSGITSLATQTTGGLDRAAASIETAAQTLDKNLDTALDRTFTAFDTGLTEITQHLSGTIAEVRDTTESVPHLIAKAQKQYDAALTALAAQTQQYIDTMKVLTEEVQRKMNSDGGDIK